MSSLDDGEGLSTDSMEGVELSMDASRDVEMKYFESTTTSSPTSTDPDSPFPFEMPPKFVAYEVQSYEDIRSYFEHTPTLSSAFSSRFGTNKGTPAADNSDEDQLVSFLSDKTTSEAAIRFWFDAPNQYEDRLSIGVTFGSLCSIYVQVFAPGPYEVDKGWCILIAMFFEAARQKFKPTDPGNVIQTRIRETAAEFDREIKSLRAPKKSSPATANSDLAKAVKTAFDAPYVDPFGAVPHYVQELVGNMDTWQQCSGKYIAPYTSLVNASMMGKTRLAKQISNIIPTVYICVRAPEEAVDDGYPKRSPQRLTDYLMRDLYDAKLTYDTNRKRFEQHYIALFVGVLSTLNAWTRGYDLVTDSEMLRKRLWRHLAQPDTLDDEEYQKTLDARGKNQDAEIFWNEVVRIAETFEKNDDTSLLDMLDKEWRLIEPYLSVSTPGLEDEKPMVLIFWDEARSLVKKAIRPNPLGDSEEARRDNLFIMVRRAIRKIGRHFADTGWAKFRIFHIFTDTTSRIGNFQPHGATDSKRDVDEDNPAEHSLMFPTLNLLPTIDLVAAKYFDKVSTSDAVQHPDRLLKFGRSAWSLYAKENNEVRTRELAKEKLFGCPNRQLHQHFNPEPEPKPDEIALLKALEDDKLRFLACLCSRLAIQTGSYVTATSNLIASHMMVLEKVGVDHHSFVSRYISEPILAEVAAEATGNYGWEMVLRTLVSELRSGVVMKSFRGEFLTRILVIIAMEDAQRRKRKENENKKQSIAANPTFLIEGQPLNPTAPWDFSQVVPVAYFLDALLQHPRQDLSPDLHRNKKQRSDDAYDQSGEHDPDNHLFSQFLLDEIQSKEIEPLERKLDKAMVDLEIKKAANSKVRTTVAGDAKRLLEEAEGNLKAANDKLEKGRKHSDTTKAMATKFLNRGRVFFNHWIPLDNPVRPSTLIKAWTRCAALICKPNTVGIDFIIPVMMKVSKTEHENKFGPVFGEWTLEQEEWAETFVSYILIQTKNQSAKPDLHNILQQCIPMTKDGTRASVVSFESHAAKNPYMSILMDFGWVHPEAYIERVEFVPTRSLAELNKQRAKVDEQIKKEERARKEEREMKKKKLQEGDTDIAAKKKSTPESRFLSNNMQERFWQIAIAVHGLDGYGYKCLSQNSREKWKDYLEEIKFDTREPWRVDGRTKLSVPQKLLLSGMHLTMEPALESGLWRSS